MIVIALTGGMLVFLIMLIMLEYFSRDKAHVQHKVWRYAGNMKIPDATESNECISKFRKFIRYLGLKARAVPQAKLLEFKMQQAGIPLLGSESFALLIMVVISAGTFGLMLTLTLGYAVCIGLLAGLIGVFYVNIRINRRQQEFSNQLGDALTMLANSMRAGFSFLQAMDLIAGEMKPPLAVEFLKTLAEIRLGTDVETALLNMGKRIKSTDLDLVITAVLIQRQVGGNLAHILDTIATTINERIKMKREIKTLTAQGRLSSWILGLLPVVIVLVAMVVNPAYMRPFIDEPIGRMALGGALVWQLVGFVFIRKIVDIDV